MKRFTSLISNFLSVLWKDMCPLVVVSVMKLVSILGKGFIAVKWLTCCGVVLLVDVSRPRLLLNSVPVFV